MVAVGAVRDDWYPELGTGEVESHEDRPIIHFGSPQGSQFKEVKMRKIERLTELVPQKALVDGVLIVTVIRYKEDGQVIVETGSGSIVVDPTRLQLLA
jgi:hypothetical protein